MSIARRHGANLVALVTFAALAVLALWVAPPDRIQGDAQRLMYLHVPAAWIAYLAYGVTSLFSVMYLVPRLRRRRWDRIAAASAEIGVLFTSLTIALGALWGRPVWGVWWTWDARLISTVVLLFLYIGYLAVRRLPASPEVRAKRAAIAALVAFIDVPIVHFSVIWWRTLHQQPTVLNPELKPQIEGIMATTLLVGVVAFTAIYVALMISRCRVSRAEQAVADIDLGAAIRMRRAAMDKWAVDLRQAEETEVMS